MDPGFPSHTCALRVVGYPLAPTALEAVQVDAVIERNGFVLKAIFYIPVIFVFKKAFSYQLDTGVVAAVDWLPVFGHSRSFGSYVRGVRPRGTGTDNTASAMSKASTPVISGRSRRSASRIACKYRMMTPGSP